MSTGTVEVEEEMHARIRAAGLRLTMPRRAICSVLAGHGEEFFSTGDVLESVERGTGPIDPSTVYRTLDEFARIGLVHHVHHGNQPGQWHLTVNHDHLHLVCERCGETQLVPTEEVQSMLDLFERKYRFRAYLHHFAILGRCESCRSEQGHPHE